MQRTTALCSAPFVVAAALAAAGCGDRVNLIQPNGSRPAINSVLVSPPATTIAVNQTLQLTAAVSATAGVVPTVVWTSSSSAATVSQSGLVTGASASPGVSICATASAVGVASVENCAAVVVQPGQAPIPLTLQIASITLAGNLNAPVPVPPASVGGQINVSVNVNPGTERMDSVVVLVNGISAATQTFTDAQAAAFRASVGAPADATAGQALQATLVFSVNTAAYASAGCATQVAPCGTAEFPNGPAAISVTGYGHQGSTPVSNSSTQGVGLLFANTDAWIVAQTLSAGTSSAFDQAGFAFRGGPSASVSVTAVPVNYSGLAIASANVNFGNAACDASGSAQRVKPLTAPAAPSRAWTATFAHTSTGTAHPDDINNYEFSTAACPVANGGGGEGAAIASAQYANTSAPTAYAAGSAIPVVRLDDRAPGSPSLMQNPRVRQRGWINAQVDLNSFNTGSAATANNVVVMGAADGGVGGVTAWVRVGTPGAGNTVDPLLAIAASDHSVVGSGALAPTVTPTTLCGVWTSRDALGNESPLPPAGTPCAAPAIASNTLLAATQMLFGVDTTPPTIAMSDGGLLASSPGLNASIGANVGGEFQVSVADTGAIGNSGIPSANAVLATVTIRSPVTGLTPAQLCPVGTVVDGACTASATGMSTGTFPIVNTTTVAAQSITGYYTFAGRAVDAAGNVSVGVASRVRTFSTGVVPGLTPASYQVPLTGTTATFTANAVDIFDVWREVYQMRYGGGAVPVIFPTVIIHPFNVAPLTPTAPAGITLNSFMRQVEIIAGNSPVTLVPGAYKPTSIEGVVVDMTGIASAITVTPIPAQNVATGVSYLDPVAFPAPQLIDSWSLTNTVQNISTGAGPGAPANPTSVALTAVVAGPTASFNPPFTVVNFYDFTAFGFEQIGATSAYSVSGNLTPMGRLYTYTLSWTPGPGSLITTLPWALGSQTIYAIGVNANGDALISPPNTGITLTNP